MRYRILMFDLFNTVALWRPERMPRHEIDGESRISTLGELRAVLDAHAGAPPFADFESALPAVSTELARERHQSGREIPSRARFERALARADMAPGSDRRALAEALSGRHMSLLAGACDVPAAHRSALSRLAAACDLLVVSNFDHGATAHGVLERDGVRHLFSHVLISADCGWRKPAAPIFESALALAGATAGEVLFIGDSFDEDIRGAAAAGFDTAWVNPKAAPRPPDAAAPTWEIASITEVENLLR